jgi:hypothetical protein
LETKRGALNDALAAIIIVMASKQVDLEMMLYRV